MSSTTASQTIPRAAATPTPVAERSLAPDLARGMMLLLIVLAHVPWFLYLADVGAAPMHPSEGGVLDRIAQIATIVVVDARTHTMFGFLFAYGIGQMVARQLSRGATFADARRVLRKRHWLLLAFGLVHATLLWQGDILGTYGLIGLVMVPLFLQRSDRTLKVWIGILLGLAAISAAVSLVTGLLTPVELANPVQDAQRALPSGTSYLATLVERVPMWGFGLVSGLASLALPAAFLMGLLAARHRVLDEPSQHLPLLRRVAIGGIALGWAAGALQALVHVGVVDVPAVTFSGIHFLTGIAAGAGYAAAFGLVAHALAQRAARRRLVGADAAPLPVRMIVALGRRSMSGYLAQSLLLVPILSAWGLGLGAHLTSATALLYGVAVWALTVVVAYALDRAGRRGPAEVLLRRLTYGRR